jgi:hypothetical protein
MDAKRVLVVANRSVATPQLLDEIRRRSESLRCEFTLLIPDARRDESGEWTLEHAVPLISEAAGQPVAGVLQRRPHPFDAIASAGAAHAAISGGEVDAPRTPSANNP